MIQPYVKNWDLFRCTGDGTNRTQYSIQWGFPENSPQKILDYARGTSTNYGYNYLYLAPINGTDPNWVSVPVNLAAVSQPAQTVLLTNSTAWAASGAIPNCQGVNGGWMT